MLIMNMLPAERLLLSKYHICCFSVHLAMWLMGTLPAAAAMSAMGQFQLRVIINQVPVA